MEEWIETKPPYFSPGIRREFSKDEFTLTYWHLPRVGAGWYLYKKEHNSAIASLTGFGERAIEISQKWADNLMAK